MGKNPNTKVVVCIWCAKAIILDTTPLSIIRIYTIMKEHDLTCEYSPNVQRIIELEAEIKKLKGK